MTSYVDAPSRVIMGDYRGQFGHWRKVQVCLFGAKDAIQFHQQTRTQL